MGTQTTIGHAYGVLINDFGENSRDYLFDDEDGGISFPEFIEEKWPLLEVNGTGDYWRSADRSLIAVRSSQTKRSSLGAVQIPESVTIEAEGLAQLNDFIKIYELNAAPAWFVWGYQG